MGEISVYEEDIKLYKRNMLFYVQQFATTEKMSRQHSTDYSSYMKEIFHQFREIFSFIREISSFMCNKFAVVRRLRKCLVSIQLIPHLKEIFHQIREIFSFMCNKFAVVRGLRKCLVSITDPTATLALAGGTWMINLIIIFMILIFLIIMN